MRRLISIVLILACILVAIRLDAFNALRIYYDNLMPRITSMPFTLPYPPPPSSALWRSMSASERLADVRTRLLPKLNEELALHQLQLGRPAYIRIFKEERQLELWLQSASGAWQAFRTYPIATYSGQLGPKQSEGDFQAPEGFYNIVAGRLNPASNYHLAFNIGYPNAYDRHHQRTGSLIMIHGDEVSVGCFAMTDPIIEEIYLIVAAALEKGQAEVPVHSFPFRMSPERMLAVTSTPWHDFWQSLRPAYDQFQQQHRLPHINVRAGHYDIKP